MRDSRPCCEDPPSPAAVDNHSLVLRKLEGRQDSLHVDMKVLVYSIEIDIFLKNGYSKIEIQATKSGRHKY